MSGKYLTPIEVAERLNVHAIKVRKWIASGKLKAINVSLGKRPEYRILESAMTEFEQSLSVVKPLPESPRRRKKQIDEIPNYY